MTNPDNRPDVQSQLAELSGIILELSEQQQKPYLLHFKRAIRNGQIDALPVETTFTIGKRSYTDHMIVRNDRFTDWHQGTLKHFELKQLRGSKSRVYRDDILQGKVDLARQIEAYRKELRAAHHPKRKPKLKDPLPIQPHHLDAPTDLPAGPSAKRSKSQELPKQTDTSELDGAAANRTDG